jgi:acyl-CoA reductase-like NAD-dependent aldehyde dehydrogenase
MDHRDAVAAYVEMAREEGATVLCGGKIPDGAEYENGAYYEPTILAGVPNTARICREEVFGPVIVVLPFDDEADVIAQSNDNDYALACGIWSRDFVKSWRVGRAISTGTVWINTYKQFSISTPFGGEKDSGLGREKGRDGMRAYMAQKSVYTDLTGAPHPWAGITRGQS